MRKSLRKDRRIDWSTQLPRSKVMGKRKNKRSEFYETVDTVIGVAWYTPEQYERLLQIADDRDNLEDTYEEWKATAEKTLPELEKAGVLIRKIYIDVAELVSWCKDQNRPVAEASRTIFVADKVEEAIDRKNRKRFKNFWSEHWKFIIKIIISIVGLIIVVLGGKTYIDLKVSQLQSQYQKQTQTQGQSVSVLIENVTKVEKHIANLDTMVNQLYGAFETEVFRVTDLDKTIIFFGPIEIEGKDQERSEVLLELKHVPIPNSIILASAKGVIAPATYSLLTFENDNRPSNILKLKTDLNQKSFKETKDYIAFFEVSYIPDKRQTHFRTLNGIKFIGVNNNQGIYKIQKRHDYDDQNIESSDVEK